MATSQKLSYVYIMASRSRNIYIGVTNSLRRRVAQHKSGEIAGYTQHYRVERLVHFEQYQYILNAIAREKELKDWRRSKKIALIEAETPTWADLAEDWSRAELRLNIPAYQAAMELVRLAHEQTEMQVPRSARDDKSLILEGNSLVLEEKVLGLVNSDDEKTMHLAADDNDSDDKDKGKLN